MNVNIVSQRMCHLKKLHYSFFNIIFKIINMINNNINYINLINIILINKYVF